MSTLRSHPVSPPLPRLLSRGQAGTWYCSGDFAKGKSRAVKRGQLPGPAEKCGTKSLVLPRDQLGADPPPVFAPFQVLFAPKIPCRSGQSWPRLAKEPRPSMGNGRKTLGSETIGRAHSLPTLSDAPSTLVLESDWRHWSPWWLGWRIYSKETRKPAQTTFYQTPIQPS